MRLLRSLLVCVILSQSVPALAETIGPPQILIAGPKVMLVTPGESKVDRQDWSRWLATYGSEVIMDASALGDVENLSDQAILDLAKVYPVDVILIIRKMGTQTLVTRLDLATNTRKSELVVVPNLKANLPDITAHPRLVVSQAIADAIRKSEEEQASLRRGQYYLRKISSTQPFVFQVGAFDKPLGEVEFYQHIGRTDLVDTYESKRSTQTVVGIGSGVSTALGLGLTFVGLLGGGLDGETTPMVMAISGGALVLGGVSGLVWALTMDTHPVSYEESLQLMEQFNQEEARQHGVQD